MTKLVSQTNFMAGQVDSELWNDTAKKAYLSSCQLLNNMVVNYRGNAQKRAGTTLQEIISNVNLSADSRMFTLKGEDGIDYLVFTGNPEFVIYDTTDFTKVYTVNTGVTYDLTKVSATENKDTLVVTEESIKPYRLYISNYSPVTFGFEEAIRPDKVPTYDFGFYTSDLSIGFLVSWGTSGSNITITVSSMNFGADMLNGIVLAPGSSASNEIGYGRVVAVTSTMLTVNEIIPFDKTVTTTINFVLQQNIFYDSHYPKRSAFYQNRLYYTGTQKLPSFIFGSKIKEFDNFDVAIGNDTDALVYQITAQKNPQITNILGGKQLEIFGSTSEFTCPQDSDEALTPATFSVRKQSSFGISDLCEPITYINDTYFINRTGKSLINFRYDDVGLSFTSTPISENATSLIKNPGKMVVMAGDEETQNHFIFLLNSDNNIVCCQFNSQLNNQNIPFGAFSTFSFPHEIIDMIVINNKVWLMSAIGSGYFLSTIDDFSSEADYILDYETSDTANGSGVLAISELYEETTIVTIEVDTGIVQSHDIETTPQITGLTAGAEYLIGYIVENQFKPAYYYYGPQASYLNKHVYKVHVDFYNTFDFEIDDFKPPQITLDAEFGTTKTMTYEYHPIRGWNRYDVLSITQSSVYNMNIISIRYEIDANMI